MLAGPPIPASFASYVLWIAPEEEHLRFTSGPHVCVLTCTSNMPAHIHAQKRRGGRGLMRWFKKHLPCKSDNLVQVP